MENDMKSGDYVSSPKEEQHSNKKPVIIGIVVVCVVVIFVFFVVKNKKQDNPLFVPNPKVEKPAVVKKKIYSEPEKLDILRSLSGLSTSTRATSSISTPIKTTNQPTIVSSQETKKRNQILQNLSGASSKTVISKEEQIKILESLK